MADKVYQIEGLEAKDAHIKGAWMVTIIEVPPTCVVCNRHTENAQYTVYSPPTSPFFGRVVCSDCFERL
jgi:hypothetical protein